MSTPGHYNDVVVIGNVRDLYTDGSGAVVGVILMVDADDPCEVPIMFPAARADVTVGVRLWVRGRLAFEPMPNRHEALLFVQARWIDSVKQPGRV